MEFQPRHIGSSISSHGGPVLSRPLRADFGVYTEGDLDYKKELILLMINNLIEFRQTLPDSVDQNNPQLFLDTCHKAKVTFSILADKEFDEIIEQLQKDIVKEEKDSRFLIKSNHFFSLCDLIVISLRKELNAVGI